MFTTTSRIIQSIASIRMKFLRGLLGIRRSQVTNYYAMVSDGCSGDYFAHSYDLACHIAVKGTEAMVEMKSVVANLWVKVGILMYCRFVRRMPPRASPKFTRNKRRTGKTEKRP